MGLDMYLSAKRYLYRDGDETISDGINELLGIPSDKSKRFHGASFVAKEISIEAMGWRKANAIHGWFVRRCQGGEDNCKEYYVSREQLEELVELCQEALDKPDHEVLEPTAGFFFGSYEKDEYYFQDLKDTIEGITKALSLPEKEYDFYYQSSW
jgi:hypothetical protein